MTICTTPFRAATFRSRGFRDGENVTPYEGPRKLKLAAPCLAVVAVLCGAPLLAQTSQPGVAIPADPPQGVLSDDWMAILLNGQKMGYVHIQQERTDDKIHTRTRTKLVLKRAGTSLDVTIEATSTETLRGAPLAFTAMQKFAGVPLSMRGAIDKGTITLVTEQFGRETEQHIAYPEGALMEWGLYLESLKHPLEAGTRFTLSAFIPLQALNVAMPITTEYLRREEIDVLGKTVSAWKAKSTMKISGADMETFSWVADDLSPVKQEMTIMGLTFQMVRCDEAYAMKHLIGVEMFLDMLIAVGKHIDRNQVHSVTYKIVTTGGEGVLDIPEGEMQKVVGRRGGEMTIKVSRLNRDALDRLPKVSPPEELAEYLRPSAFITSDDPQVLAMARSAAGDEKQPHKVAARLCRAVAEEVKYKDLGTAFATAAEVCRKKTGDCTEHGVLLAALGRAVGIPTRVVTGLLYVPEIAGQRDVLGFHMWTQFWIAGKWIDLDAAWNQVDVDPTHLALSTQSLQHGSIGSLISSVMLKVDTLRVSIIDTEPRQQEGLPKE